MQGAPPWVLGLGMALVTLVPLSLSVWAFGGPRAFFAHPARTGLAAGMVAAIVAVAFSGMSLDAGRSRDTTSGWIFVPIVPLAIALIWLVPYLDRRDLLVIDGDAVRYLGLALFAAGGALRIWPMYSLGWRFSPVIGIQEGHELVTRGPYRLIRHPSYLGGIVGTAGWALVFRSSVGMVVLMPLIWLTLVRIDAEEHLLGSTFGAAWADYRRRTWRLVPFVY